VLFFICTRGAESRLFQSWKLGLKQALNGCGCANDYGNAEDARSEGDALDDGGEV
jgi:hypothetical protein